MESIYTSHFDGELLRLLPRVLRARDFHLYLEGGKRLTDLWRSGGRAVLGHKAPRVIGELKNAAERGLFTPLPHPLERRLFKALGEFFPGRAFRLYPDESSLCRALEKAGFAESPENLCLWRPFLETPEPEGASGVNDKNAPILIPVLPWPLGPEALVLEKSVENAFPQGELIPPVLLAPAARALYDLAAALKTFSPGGPSYAKIDKALGIKKSEWFLWRRRGIYLSSAPGIDMEAYGALFRRFLEGGFLIPPSPEAPLILPLAMSSGEESKLAELLGS